MPLPIASRIRPFLRKQWKEWRATVFLIAFVIIPMKSSFADWNWVPTGSMNPTIVEGDLVYVNKLAYDLRAPLTLWRLAKWSDPEKGDIVVLFSPQDGTRLVKRVIGVPGDTVEMRRNRLFINGEPLSYAELPPERSADLATELQAVAVFAEEDLSGHRHAVMALPQRAGIQRSFPPVTIPAGKCFVMGDNRDNSQDSRSFGLADRRQIIGEATSVIASFNILDRYQPRLGRFFSDLE